MRMLNFDAFKPTRKTVVIKIPVRHITHGAVVPFFAEKLKKMPLSKAEGKVTMGERYRWKARVMDGWKIPRCHLQLLLFINCAFHSGDKCGMKRTLCYWIPSAFLRWSLTESFTVLLEMLLDTRSSPSNTDDSLLSVLWCLHLYLV